MKINSTTTKTTAIIPERSEDRSSLGLVVSMVSNKNYLRGDSHTKQHLIEKSYSSKSICLPESRRELESKLLKEVWKLSSSLLLSG